MIDNRSVFDLGDYEMVSELIEASGFHEILRFDCFLLIGCKHDK